LDYSLPYSLGVYPGLPQRLWSMVVQDGDCEVVS
jgi:hypothetical protein